MDNVVIWFNNWYSSLVYNIINLKKLMPELHIIGTNFSENCTYKNFVDEFYIEKDRMHPKHYLDWALDFCKEHNVSIFFVRNQVNIIAKNKEEFDKIGVTIVCESAYNLNIFKSKSIAYGFIKESQIWETIPEYTTVKDPEDFNFWFDNYNKRGDKVCIKYDEDEGAQSFRYVDNSMLCRRGLSSDYTNTISQLDAYAIIEAMNDSHMNKLIMVMPRLNGPEVSIDCYNSPSKGFIAIPRFKVSERVKEFKLDEKLIELCKKIQLEFNFDYIYNVQFRWDKYNNPKLLEINTRPSGGIHMDILCGFDFIYQVICDILGIESKQSVEGIKECTITQFETPVII